MGCKPSSSFGYYQGESKLYMTCLLTTSWGNDNIMEGEHWHEYFYIFEHENVSSYMRYAPMAIALSSFPQH